MCPCAVARYCMLSAMCSRTPADNAAPVSTIIAIPSHIQLMLITLQQGTDVLSHHVAFMLPLLLSCVT